MHIDGDGLLTVLTPLMVMGIDQSEVVVFKGRL